MQDRPVIEWLSRSHWQRWLVWLLFLLAVYELRDFFLVAFVVFLLCYLVRAIVGWLSRRLAPGAPRVWLDRTLTLATFAAMAGLFVGFAWWIGPRLVRQCHTLLARHESVDPQAAFQRVLSRSVGALLMRRKYGGPDDDRYRAALKQYQQDERHGEGWYVAFPAIADHLNEGFEAQYEQQERARIDWQVRDGAAAGDRFDQWFLRVKAPELFSQRREQYLAQWSAEHSATASQEGGNGKHPGDDFQQRRDEQIRQRILEDVKADAVVMADLKHQWERSLVARHWLAFRQTAEYQAAFRDYYVQRHEANPEGIPFSYETYLALRDAYPLGREAFARVVRSHAPSQPAESNAQLRTDFELATRHQLTQAWWADDSLAATLRDHVSKSLPGLVEAVGARLEGLVRELLTLPAQLATALLLTLFICFDMLHLRESMQRLRESRIGHFYDELAPGVVVFARLIGRAFSAQALIAVFNTLLTFLLLWFLGVENEVLLCIFVFIGSFIPVVGVLLSSVPIAIQAISQPDGSIGLALFAIAGILLVHFTETSFLSPKIVGTVLHLHPVMVLAILAIGEHFFGIWGLLLGVPVAVYLFRVVILKEAIPGIYEPTPE